MRITMISKADFAASGYKTVEAIKRHTDHDIEIYVKRNTSRLGHKHGTFIRSDNFHEIQERINESDIVHVKGDWPPGTGYCNFQIMHKPVIVSVSGGYFRKKEHTGLGQFHPWQYARATLKTAMTPDLCYPEYSDIWTPHPIDSDNNDIEWERPSPPLFIHSRVSEKKGGKKGTDFIKKVWKHVAKKRKIETEYITGIKLSDVIEARKRATIFFDQFGVGFYGNSAIEAMQYGIPTCGWIASWALEQVRGDLMECPVLSLFEKDVEKWAKMILDTLDSDMVDLSIQTKKWCDMIHGYKAIAAQWDELYKSML